MAMTKVKRILKTLIALESMWSLARLVTDDDDDDTGQSSWVLVRKIGTAIAALTGTGAFAWLSVTMDRYPWLESILLCVLGFASGFVVSRLYSVWKIKNLQQRQRDQSPPKRLKEAWEVPGAESQVFTLREVAALLHPSQPGLALDQGLVDDEMEYLAKAVKAERLEVMPEEDDTGNREFDMAWIRSAETADELRCLRVHRKVLREFLKSVSRPVPEFLDERFDW